VDKKLLLFLILWYLLISVIFGFFPDVSSRLDSSFDAKTYIAHAPHRTPCYPFIIDTLGLGVWLWLFQALLWLASAYLISVISGNRLAGVLFSANLGLIALTYHALTETIIIFIVVLGLYACKKGFWPGVVLALLGITMIKPVIPIPLDSYMASVDNALGRFCWQSKQLGNSFAAWGNNVLSNIFAFSNFLPRWMRIPTCIYTSVVWLVAGSFWFSSKNRRLDLLAGFALFYIFASGFSYAQGDRLLLPVFPILVYFITGKENDISDRECLY
jgi:hypothetical protein